MDLRGRHVTIMGLGNHGGGVAATRYVAAQGAEVTITDLASESTLGPSLDQLADVPLRAIHLGRHDEAEFRRSELVVANPAVRPDNRFLQIAADHGAAITTEIGLFMEACRAPILGVSGSNGKTTTASMIASALRADGKQCFLGGNLGGSLLPELAKITPKSQVVLELSSFQLARCACRRHGVASRRWPRVAVVTGVSPNHLDWHGSYENYIEAKQSLVERLPPAGLAILNPYDRSLCSWHDHLAQGRILRVPPLSDLPPLRVRGRHNRINAALATTAALAVGCRPEKIAEGLARFEGLPHRLEEIGSIDGRTFFNDSKSTTPEATFAALRSMNRPTWLLAGGYGKEVDLDGLADYVKEKVRGACFFGAARRELRDRASTARGAARIHSTETMARALEWCWSQSRPGDSLLLSPACSSLDQFANFAERGRKFIRGVRKFGQLVPTRQFAVRTNGSTLPREVQPL